MGDVTNKYKLVHLTTGGEYKTPLVASQLFDQAEWQAITTGDDAPTSVEAWIVGAFREYYDKAAQEKVKNLASRCPHIRIEMMNGISRLNKFPVMQLLQARRRKLGKNIRVIYHCRGEKVAEWALKLREKYPQDKVILDVRGYWPAEKLYANGITDPATATGKDLFDFKEAYNYLKDIIGKVDGVTTVSDALKELLMKEMKAPADTSVVPCCVSAITDENKRKEIRREWGIKDDEVALVYSGTTAAYQHLEDLTIPFMKVLADSNTKVRLVFLSSEHEKIRSMLIAAGIDTSNVVLKGLKQNEVGPALTACDAGILIRKPTLVNRVANPVKIAEYMAAGLPIIIERGVGGVAEKLFEMNLLKGIEIAEGGDLNVEAGNVDEWLRDGLKEKRQSVREYVKQTYLWSSAIHVSRKMYEQALLK